MESVLGEPDYSRVTLMEVDGEVFGRGSFFREAVQLF